MANRLKMATSDTIRTLAEQAEVGGERREQRAEAGLRLGELARVDVVRRAGRRRQRIPEDERRATDLDDVAVAQRDPLHALALHERAVPRVTVLEQP